MPNHGFSLTARGTRWTIAALFLLAALAVGNAVALTAGWYGSSAECPGRQR